METMLLELLGASSALGIGALGISAVWSNSIQVRYASALRDYQDSVRIFKRFLPQQKGTSTFFQWKRPSGVRGPSDWYSKSGLDWEPPGPDHYQLEEYAVVLHEDMVGLPLAAKRGWWVPGRPRHATATRFIHIGVAWPADLGQVSFNVGSPLARCANALRKEYKTLDAQRFAKDAACPLSPYQRLVLTRILRNAWTMLQGMHRHKWAKRVTAFGATLGLTTGLASVLLILV